MPAPRRRGCGYTDPHPLPEDPLVVDAPSLGKHGGRFVFGITGNPRTFNALMANEVTTTDVTDHRLFTYLVHYDNAKQQVVPMIAKSWDASPDGLAWTFHLRRGAKFSDGHPITSEDVLFSAQVALDETLHPAVQDMLKLNGKPFEFSAPDPHTVVVKTPAPFATMLIAAGALEIMPKHVLEGAYKSGNFASGYNVNTPPDQIVTSGPWRVVQYVPGEKTVLGRNPYWLGVDKANKRLPYLNELVYPHRARPGRRRFEVPLARARRGRQRQARELRLVRRQPGERRLHAATASVPRTTAGFSGST